MFLVIARTVNM